MITSMASTDLGFSFKKLAKSAVKGVASGVKAGVKVGYKIAKLPSSYAYKVATAAAKTMCANQKASMATAASAGPTGAVAAAAIPAFCKAMQSGALSKIQQLLPQATKAAATLAKIKSGVATAQNVYAQVQRGEVPSQITQDPNRLVETDAEGNPLSGAIGAATTGQRLGVSLAIGGLAAAAAGALYYSLRSPRY